MASDTKLHRKAPLRIRTCSITVANPGETSASRSGLIILLRKTRIDYAEVVISFVLLPDGPCKSRPL
jgi:hypothetical protein